MNLESIVPPFELCKLIPVGSFADSALVWSFYEDEIELGTWIIPRQIADEYSDLGDDGQTKISAPTLSEIMVSLPDGCCCIYLDTSPNFVMECSVIDDNPADNNAAISALRLWLKLQGIEVK